MTVGATTDAQYDLIQHAGGRRAEIYKGLRDIAARYGASIRQHYPRIPRRVSGYNLDDLLPENSFHVARSLWARRAPARSRWARPCGLFHSRRIGR